MPPSSNTRHHVQYRTTRQEYPEGMLSARILHTSFGAMGHHSRGIRGGRDTPGGHRPYPRHQAGPKVVQVDGIQLQQLKRGQQWGQPKGCPRAK